MNLYGIPITVVRFVKNVIRKLIVISTEVKRNEIFRHFGEILEIGKDKKEKEWKRMRILREMANVEEIELLYKSNITKYTKLLADSFARDLGGDKHLDKERTFIAGRVYENEKLLKGMEEAKEFFKKYDKENTGE